MPVTTKRHQMSIGKRGMVTVPSEHGPRSLPNVQVDAQGIIVRYGARAMLPRIAPDPRYMKDAAYMSGVRRVERVNMQLSMHEKFGTMVMFECSR